MQGAAQGSIRHFPGSRRIVVMLVLALTGATTWWWLAEQRATAPTDKLPRQPDSYFRGLDILRHDASGAPEMRVTADYAEHFENETWIHLHALEARGLVAGPGWQLRADRGRLTDDGVELETRGNVVLLRTGEGGSPMRLQTDELFVNTETEIAATDTAVRITQGASVITGRGLWVSLADDRLRIESDVEARYAE